MRWDIVKMATPGLVAGTLLGAVVADRMASKYLAIFFVAFVYFAAVQMFVDVKPKPSRILPGRAGMSVAAIITGIVSSLVGAGGGLLSIPLMTMCNVPMRNAVGTSAALGLPIAIAGTAGYVYTGLGQDHLPPLTLGTFTSGAGWNRIALSLPCRLEQSGHTMPVPRLKKIFAMILSGCNQMLWTLF